jgi:membrane protein
MVKKLYSNFIENEISALSAQVTYYLILSFFPFLIFLFTIISYTSIVQSQSVFFISRVLPTSIYQLVMDVVEYGVATRKSAFISIGMLATIWSASSGVYAFILGINKIYGKRETRPFWRVRLLSILFTLGLAMIIIFSLVLVVFGELIGRYVMASLTLAHQFNRLWHILRFAVSIATLFAVFILFYKYIPNCKLPVKKVLPGVFFSTTGWVILSAGFAFYVNNFGSFSKIYGSIGAVIALLIWIYWSSIIVFIGSEINAVLYNPNSNKN